MFKQNIAGPLWQLGKAIADIDWRAAGQALQQEMRCVVRDAIPMRMAEKTDGISSVYQQGV